MSQEGRKRGRGRSGGGLVSLMASECSLLFHNAGHVVRDSAGLFLFLPPSALTVKDPSFTTREISSARAGRPSHENESLLPRSFDFTFIPMSRQENAPTSAPRRNNHSAALFWPGGLYFSKAFNFD